MKIFADTVRLTLNNWNIGHGNKISHLFFLIKLANRVGAKPVVTLNSSLDDIFDLSLIKEESTKHYIEECIFEEVSAFPGISLYEKVSLKLGLFPFLSRNLIKAAKNSQDQANLELNFLNNSGEFKEGFVRGHFWHYDLMPTRSTFEKFVSIKVNLLEQCRLKYPDIESQNSVIVHLRDTDFKNHLPHIFKKPIALPDEYYYKAIELCEEEFEEKDLTYHLFSDNHDRISGIFKNKKFVLHEDSAEMDWVCIFLGKKIIQSNSTFCWTASLFKEFSIQPKGGYNWAYPKIGEIPFGFEMPFSKTIDI